MKVKSFMKNTWHLLACLMLLVACSDDKVEDETTITLPPETETLFEKGVNFTTSAVFGVYGYRKLEHNRCNHSEW